MNVLAASRKQSVWAFFHKAVIFYIKQPEHVRINEAEGTLQVYFTAHCRAKTFFVVLVSTVTLSLFTTFQSFERT